MAQLVEYKNITMRDETWFMTRLHVVTTDGTVAYISRTYIGSTNNCPEYINFFDLTWVRITFLQASNTDTRQAIAMKLVVQALNLVYLHIIVYIFELQLHKHLKMDGV